MKATVKVVDRDDKGLTVVLEINGVKKQVGLHPDCYRADLTKGAVLTTMELVDGKLRRYRTNAVKDDAAVALLLGEVAS